MNLGCLINPIGCAETGLSVWYHAIDPMWFLTAGLVIGLLLGAWLGRWGVAALGGIVIAALLLFRRPVMTHPIEHLPDGHPDAVPPIGTRRPTAAPQGETAWDKMVRGEQIK
jgi:hypothetical protein